MNIERAKFLLAINGYDMILDPDGNWNIQLSMRNILSISPSKIIEMDESDLLKFLGIPSNEQRAQIYKSASIFLKTKEFIPDWTNSFQPKNILEAEIIETFKIMALVLNIKNGVASNIIYSQLPERKHKLIAGYLESLSQDIEEEYLFMSAPMIVKKFAINIEQARFHLAKWLWETK
ncbi:MAG: hypothetical protein H6653_07610 [Ardenticatenaceae bacterium]|nr:hypothetical protein [Ardenticatenaceae bacterium]